MRVTLDDGAITPVRKHGTDAGLDIAALEDAIIPAHGYTTIRTGVHVEIPPGTAGVLMSRSGLNLHHGVTTTGLIDEGFTGEIVVSAHNDGDEDVHVRHGDRITQLTIIPVLYEDVRVVDSLNAGERGTDGYGSTGLS